jgi:hypothetical protein
MQTTFGISEKVTLRPLGTASPSSLAISREGFPRGADPSKYRAIANFLLVIA